MHPGYGFLSENAAFAEACEAAGIIFVGPPGPVMRAMGSKTGTRAAVAAAGVPVVPGATPRTQDQAAIADAIRQVGLPVMLKAAGGGGGKGMRVVRREDEIATAIESARGEARRSFGNDALYVERLIERARHIEVQVIADRHGQAVHVFERDCTLQRRHQKVIEEAPAPAVTEALRDRLTRGRAEGRPRRPDTSTPAPSSFSSTRRSDGEPDFYFLEMNTRLQVEHPVTEAITGLDLVRAQIEVANGDPLPFRQSDIRATATPSSAVCTPKIPYGCSRNPGAFCGIGSRTATASASIPASSQGQHDHGALRSDDREAHRARTDASGGARAEPGCAWTIRDPRHSSQPLVSRGACSGDLRSGPTTYTRASSKNTWTSSFGHLIWRSAQPRPPSPRASRRPTRCRRNTKTRQPRSIPGRRSAPSAGNRCRTRLRLTESGARMGGRSHGGRSAAEPRVRHRRAAGNRRQTFSVTPLADDQFRIESASGTRQAIAVLASDIAWVSIDDQVFEVHVATAGRAARSSARDHDALAPPMSATVVRIAVKPGDRVQQGDLLVSLEAMKMELPIRAPRDGVVTAVHCREGELVQPAIR